MFHFSHFSLFLSFSLSLFLSFFLSFFQVHVIPSVGDNTKHSGCTMPAIAGGYEAHGVVTNM
jgi:hypothetical protein